MLLIEAGPEVGLDVDAIVEAAQRRTGLSMPGDTGFMPGLEALVDSIGADVWSGFTPRVRASIGRWLAHLLAGRMAVLACRAIRSDQRDRMRSRFRIGMGRIGSP